MTKFLLYLFFYVFTFISFFKRADRFFQSRSLVDSGDAIRHAAFF
jgi:hypothetical protein